MSGTLYVLYHSNFTLLPGTAYPHFTDGESKTGGLSNVNQLKQLLGGRAVVSTQGFLAPLSIQLQKSALKSSATAQKRGEDTATDNHTARQDRGLPRRGSGIVLLHCASDSSGGCGSLQGGSGTDGGGWE